MKQELATAREVRRNLKMLCARLEQPTPRSLKAGAVELNTAIRSLRDLEHRLRSSGREWRERAILVEISAIRQEVSRAQALLEGAGRFLQTWAQLLAADTGGSEQAPVNYGPGGVSGPVLAVDRGKVVLHG